MQTSQVSAGTGANSLGKYRLIAELGHGGMAEVFLAVVRGPAGFNKLVVVKQIRPQLAEDPEFLGMFLDEARLAARLSHPNVVQTNEVGQEGERYFIAMEYLEGQPLNRVLHRLSKVSVTSSPSSSPGRPTVPDVPSAPSSGSESGRPPPATGLKLAMHLRIISDVLAGLHHAHELTDYDGTALGVVHRDVTPHNIFVTYDGQVKVVDFGIAKALNSSSETRTGVLKGKVAYMAPEQAQGERVDRRADIFSVGVLIWEAATGRRLWKGVPDITILQRLLSGDVPPPSTLNPDVAEPLSAIIQKAMAHRREDRYETALDLQNDLDAFIESLGGRTSPRDIGKVISAAFEADRTRIKGIIEEQIRSHGAPLTPLVMTDTSRSLPRIDPNTQGSMSVAGLTGSGERYILDNSPSRMESNPSRSAPSSYTGPSFTSASVLPDSMSRPRRRGLLALAAVAVAFAAAGGVWLALTHTQAPARASSAVAPVAVVEVEINIVASPTEARISVDGKPVSNPYRSRLPADTAIHEVRIEANGFLTITKPMSFDHSADVELALQRVPNDKPEKPEKTSPPPPVRSIVVTPPPDDGKRQGKPRRTIDPNNPYAQ
jgi:eukaryotic-like serine/threonine-protein kinase